MSVVVAILVISFTIHFLFGTINPFYVVVSGSMIPNLNIGDLLIIDHNYSYNSLKVGDIIVFNTPGVNDKGQHLTIVHRVADIITVPGIERGGSNNDQNNNHNSIIKIIRTKGDANPGSIILLDYPIRQQNYIGKVVYVIPKVGLVTMVIRPPINYIIIGAIVIVIVYFIRRQMMQQQQEGR